MEQLADRYAELKGTKVIASRIHDNMIIFVLESGPKLTMSTRQLEEAIAELEPAPKPEPEPKPKGKGKKS